MGPVFVLLGPSVGGWVERWIYERVFALVESVEKWGAQAEPGTYLTKEPHEGGEFVRDPEGVVGVLRRELPFGQHLFVL